MPVWVQPSLVNLYCKKGYLKTDPKPKVVIKEVEVVKFVKEPVEMVKTIAEEDQIPQALLLLFNQGTEDDLVAQKGIGKAIADKIIEARPIASKLDLDEFLPRPRQAKIISEFLN